MQKITSIVLTVVMLSAIVAGIVFIWDRYMYTPWTRDGRVRAAVVSIAPDVSGWVDSVHAENASEVKAGDVLFTVDRARYQAAFDLAQAQADASRAAMEKTQGIYQRRSNMKDGVFSQEATENARLDFQEAQATDRQALATLESARLDLERTVYKAPADGKITNLAFEKGDYAQRGTEAISLTKDGSFYITGYFEETKIPQIRVGDEVLIWLMSGTVELKGKVSSIDAGISNSNITPGNEHLPDVEPTFAWIRLAQRIPVNIAIVSVPANVTLSSGMSATLKVVSGHLGDRGSASVFKSILADMTSVLP